MRNPEHLAGPLLICDVGDSVLVLLDGWDGIRVCRYGAHCKCVSREVMVGKEEKGWLLKKLWPSEGGCAVIKQQRHTVLFETTPYKARPSHKPSRQQ